jgi:Holliday junction resolvase RusA-like endonuclease
MKTIYIEPVAKARARVVVKNGRTLAFTPTKTKDAEQAIRIAILEDDTYEAGVPLKLTAIFYRQRPKALPKKIDKPIQKPDLDNYEKTLMDACEKYLYPNDSQITTKVTKKRFGSPPRIEFVLERDFDS